MPEPTTRRVLLCGGPADGQWLTVPTHQHDIRFPRPVRVTVTAAAGPEAALADLDLDIYRIEPVPIGVRDFTAALWVAVLDGTYGRDVDKAIIRAVLQRDVARQLLGDR